MAKAIKKRIKLQSGNTRFDIDINSPIINIHTFGWFDDTPGCTFLFNTVKQAAQSHLEGYSEFICIDQSTHTDSSLKEVIESSHNKIIMIDDAWWFNLKSITDLILDSDNQYILIKNGNFAGETKCEFLETEHDGDTLVIKANL